MNLSALTMGVVRAFFFRPSHLWPVLAFCLVSTAIAMYVCHTTPLTAIGSIYAVNIFGERLKSSNQISGKTATAVDVQNQATLLGDNSTVALNYYYNKYRSRFKNDWNKFSPKIGGDFVDGSEKYVIYYCGEGMSLCHGWSDRVKGMILAYVIANLTGRIFKFDMRMPNCDVTNAVVPNRVDWRLARPFHQNISLEYSPSQLVKLDIESLPIRTYDFDAFSRKFDLKNIRYLYMNGNLDYVDALKHSKRYARSLTWMQGERKDRIFSEIYRRLFRLNPNLENRLELFLNKHLPTSHHKLICGHIRMGRSPAQGFERDPIRMSHRFLPNVWKFIASHSKNDSHKVFVISDSVATIEEASRQRFASRMISSPGPIRHLMKSEDDGSSICQAIEKVVFDQAVLMNCDVLLVSMSGLSRMAAFVRGSDEGLYCLFPWGKIDKCSANKFTELYRITG